MSTILIAAAAVVVVVVIVVAAWALLRNRPVDGEDEKLKVTEDHIIEKMNTILRYQNVDRP